MYFLITNSNNYGLASSKAKRTFNGVFADVLEFTALSFAADEVQSSGSSGPEVTWTGFSGVLWRREAKMGWFH